MELTLESLGLTRDELLERVVDRLVYDALRTVSVDDSGEGHEMPTPFSEAMRKAVKDKIDEAITDIAGRNVLPNVAAYVESTCLQATSEWGDKKGPPLTFTEYLVARANAYLTEPVSYDGKTKGEAGYGTWNKAQTRIAHLVHQHLHYQIESAMKVALQQANSAIVGGIQEAVKIKLDEIAKTLQMSVKTK